MSGRNPFRKYRNKYLDKLLVVIIIELAILTYYVSLPMLVRHIPPAWFLTFIFATLIVGIVGICLAILGGVVRLEYGVLL